MAIHKDERREGYVELPHTFVEKLEDHIKAEETRDSQTEKIFKRGAERMDAIEKDLAVISGIVTKADGFILAAQIATRVIIVVGAALIATLLWVAKEKNTEFLRMQDSIDTHSLQINETLVILRATINANDKRHNAIDSVTGPGYGHANGNGKK